MLILSTELRQFKRLVPVLNPLRLHGLNISCLIIPTDVAKMNFRQRKRTIPKMLIQRFWLQLEKRILWTRSWNSQRSQLGPEVLEIIQM